jgi:hypothetical protein
MPSHAWRKPETGRPSGSFTACPPVVLAAAALPDVHLCQRLNRLNRLPLEPARRQRLSASHTYGFLRLSSGNRRLSTIPATYPVLSREEEGAISSRGNRRFTDMRPIRDRSLWRRPEVIAGLSVVVATTLLAAGHPDAYRRTLQKVNSGDPSIALLGPLRLSDVDRQRLLKNLERSSNGRSEKRIGSGSPPAMMLAQADLSSAADQIHSLAAQENMPGLAGTVFDRDDDDLLLLYWHGDLPASMRRLVRSLRGTIKIRVIQADYSRDVLLAEAERIIKTDPRVAGIGSLPDFSGLDVQLKPTAPSSTKINSSVRLVIRRGQEATFASR